MGNPIVPIPIIPIPFICALWFYPSDRHPLVRLEWGMTPKSGIIGWYEHHSGDASESKDFYQKVCNWTMEPTEMDDHDDWTAVQDGIPVFGLIQDFPGFEGYRGWLPYFMVDDLAGARERALAAGASEIHPVVENEGEGAWCALSDPDGVPFALYQAAV